MAGDIHFPRHDKRNVSLWFDVLRYLKPQAVDLLGDIDDAHETSRWVAGTSDAGFSLASDGITMTSSFLKDIHALVPRADKHFHDGNHGWTRHKKWLEQNAPQTLVDGVYSPKILYQYDKYGFDWHEWSAPPVHRYGDIYAHHGDSISKYAAESVRNDALNWGVSVVRGHSHRLGRWEQTYPIDGRTIRGFEGGHLCDPSQMLYDRSPNWQAGFLFGLVSGDEVFITPVEIRNNTCVIGTKVFSS